MTPDEVLAEVARLKAIIAQHDLCHDLHGKVGAREFAEGCAQEQRKHYGRAPHQDALRALILAVEGYLDHPGCNNPARATAMRKLRWAMEQARNPT